MTGLLSALDALAAAVLVVSAALAITCTVVYAFFSWANSVPDAWERGSVRRFMLLATLPVSVSVSALWLLVRSWL